MSNQKTLGRDINERLRTQIYVADDFDKIGNAVGRIAYIIGSNKLYYCSGTKWEELNDSSVAASNVHLVSSKEELDTLEQAKIGDCAIVKDTSKQYYFNGDTWVLVDTEDRFDLTSSVTLEGISAGEEFKNATAEEILRALLEKELFPNSAVPPSAEISVKVNGSPIASSYEYGTVLSNIELTGVAKLGSVSGYNTNKTNVYINTGTQDAPVIEEVPANSVSWAGNVVSENGYTFEGNGINSKITQSGSTYTISSYEVPASDVYPNWKVSIDLSSGPDFRGSKGHEAKASGTFTGNIKSKTVNASKLINISMPWFATTDSCDKLTRQDNYDIKYTTLPKNSTAAVKTNGITLASESSTNEYRQAFLIPTAWDSNGITSIKQWNDVANAFNIDATSEFKLYNASVSFTGNIGTVTVCDPISKDAKGKDSYTEMIITTSGNVPAKNTQDWIYIVHEGDAVGERIVYITK